MKIISTNDYFHVTSNTVQWHWQINLTYGKVASLINKLKCAERKGALARVTHYGIMFHWFYRYANLTLSIYTWNLLLFSVFLVKLESNAESWRLWLEEFLSNAIYYSIPSFSFQKRPCAFIYKFWKVWAIFMSCKSN